ncbi:F-box/LRR-repeat protein 4 [Neolamprologus brichardi]|uniref:F-box/LRR-repeat protein 4 n=1 Tax=Neolamprologus brichardi TaxID=32507 RepID=UPI0003EC609D|nr:F-box/LRR-repeat protein 4 [Neolamprologus brichardi]
MISERKPHDEDDAVETPGLPVEVVVYILSFLHASDRKEASLVCRSWYSASQDPRFQRNITFRFPASASSLELIRGLGRKPRCSLIISQLDGFSISRSLLLEVGLCLGPKLESLALPGSSITEASLLALLPRLSSLRRLDLRGLDSLFMSGAFLSREEHRQQVRSALCGLEELDLSDLRYLSDLTFNRLTGCTPRLRRLSLAGCHIAFEFDPYRGCPVGAVEDSSALLSLRNLRRLLMEQKSTLVALDLSRTSITPESLRTVAQVGCRHKFQRLSDLLLLPSLRSLDLSECLHINGTEMVKGLKGSDAARRQLETLNLRSCTYIRDPAVFFLARLLGDTLCELDLTSCSNVTDLSVCAVATYLQKLVVLRLGWCKEVTDWGLLGMVQRAKCEPDEETGDKGPRFTRTFGNMGFFKPPRLPFEERPKLVTPNDLEQFRQQAGASLLALSRLQELDLSACSKLTDSSITQVMRFPDLHHLSLSMLPEITDDSFVSTARHCRSLTSLVLSHCPGISDRGVAQAAPYLPRLQHLYLSCCNNITDRSLLLLVQHCKRLRTLDISRCNNISVAAVDFLQTQLPFLENLHYKFKGGADLSLSL